MIVHLENVMATSTAVNFLLAIAFRSVASWLLVIIKFNRRNDSTFTRNRRVICGWVGDELW